MIVVDTSAFVSLSIGEVLDIVLAEYDVRTTDRVAEELRGTARYDDIHGRAASEALDSVDSFSFHEIDAPDIETSRIDSGEAGCVALARRLDADFLITAELRALPELQALTDAQVAISPILLRALVTREVLTTGAARSCLDQIAESRDWFGAPIYRRAQRLFE